MRKLILTLSFITVLMSACDNRIDRLANYAGGNKNTPSSTVYDFNFLMPKSITDEVAYYHIKYQEISEEEALSCALAFGLQDYFETGSFYQFEEGFQKLIILKNGSAIYYENKQQEETGAVYSQQQLAEMGAGLMRQWGLPVYYNWADIEYITEQDVFQVSYINQLNSLDNYAAVKKINIDRYGNIRGFEYTDATYVMAGSCSVLPVKKAMEKLKAYTITSPLCPEVFVDIKGYRLVYVQENERVIPVYYFYGETSEGENFSQIIEAVKN